MANSEWKKLYPIVLKIEDEYGSVAKAPKSDPLMRKLKTYQVQYATRNSRAFKTDYKTKRKLKKSYEKKIIAMAIKGYNTPYIAKKLQIGYSTVSNHLRTEGIRIKRPFHFVLISPDGQYYYTGDLMNFYHFIFHKMPRNVKAGEIYFKKKGWMVQKKIVYWFQIPIGAWYYHGYLTKPIKKVNEVDFAYSDFIPGGAK